MAHRPSATQRASYVPPNGTVTAAEMMMMEPEVAFVEDGSRYGGSDYVGAASTIESSSVYHRPSQQYAYGSTRLNPYNVASKEYHPQDGRGDSNELHDSLEGSGPFSWADSPPIDPLQSLTKTKSHILLRDQLTDLRDEGFPTGLADELGKTRALYPVRFWVLDNSGSMISNDGSCIRGASSFPCTRWAVSIRKKRIQIKFSTNSSLTFIS